VSDEAVIVGASLGAGHDGRAELVVELAFPNGGRSSLSVTEEVMAAALDAAGLSSVDDLLGQPWTVLAAGGGTHPSATATAADPMPPTRPKGPPCST
jgi:hypothetical protein